MPNQLQKKLNQQKKLAKSNHKLYKTKESTYYDIKNIRAYE